MKKFPVPNKQGFYWAANKTTPEIWEPVEVLISLTSLIVYCLAYYNSWEAEAFVWGPEISIPPALGGNPEPTDQTPTFP